MSCSKPLIVVLKYVPDEAQNTAKVDDRIWLINHLGQAELLTADLSLANEEQQK